MFHYVNTLRHFLHYFHCLINCMSLSSLAHTDYITYIFKCQVLTPVWLISTILLNFITIYFIFILCSLIYRPRNQVTSQNVIWTARVIVGGGPRVVVSTAAFHARVRGSAPGLGGFKETKMFLPHPRVRLSIAGASVTEK